jgi:predicted transcriptional regulator
MTTINSHSDTEPVNVEESRISLIKDYIYYSNKPFTSTQIVAELGICYETVKKYLQELIKSEYIKQIGKDKCKNIYVYNKIKQSKSYTVKGKRHTFESIQEHYQEEIKKKRELLELL